MKYPVCVLSHILTPGKYCVVSTNKEHVSEVMELEENMKKEICFDEILELDFKFQMCVAVRDFKGKLKRGIVERKVTDTCYRVLLIDYGQVLDIEKSEIRMITNEDFMKVEPLAFLVKLYGLIPSKFISVGPAKKARACNDWGPESKEFVHNLFKTNNKVVIQSTLLQQRTVYGDLFVQLVPNKKYVSVRKLLCKKQFCAYSESYFLNQEKLTLSGESLEVEKKMEWVEKWRRENFGVEFQKFYRLPMPAYTSDTSITNITSLGISASSPESELSDQKNLITPPVSVKLGSGRGKLKLLVNEMKKKKESSVGAKNESSQSNDFLIKNDPKMSIGRGHLLKKYLESIKPLSHDIPDDPCTEYNSKELSSEVFSSIEKLSDNEPKGKSKVEKAVIKSGEFSEFSDSNELTEVSLSTSDGPPPLVQNICIEKIFGEENGTRNNCDVLSSSSTKMTNKSRTSSKKNSEGEVELCSNKTNITSSKSSAGNQSVKEKDSRRSSRFCLADVWEYSPDHFYSSQLNPFVLFNDSAVKPVQTFRELPIQPKIIRNLERGGMFNRLSPLQTWVIPAIRKQHNTVVIGSAKTGKTLAYVVPLMDYVFDDHYFEELPKGNGPVVVVVASSSSTCESIYYLCLSLLGFYTSYDMINSKVKIVMAHGGGRESEIFTRVSNGCSVLISTPHCLVRLLEQPFLTNFHRLTCLVLDEVDIISQNPFRKSLRVILEKAEFGTKDRHYQKIFVGEKWTPSVENFIKSYVKSYALVIGSFSEVAIYAGLRPRLFLVDKNRKPEILLEKLKELKTSKTVIVCEDTSEASSLKDFLNERGIPVLLAHENIMAEELKDIRAEWKASGGSVLVFTDGVLNELQIRDAQTLIHYGLPSESKTNFYLRYSTLESFLLDRQNSKEKETERKVHDIILIDDENHYQLPHIVDFVTRLKGKLPVEVMDKSQEIQRQIEISKDGVPLCENLLSFGRCRNSKNCRQRHAFVKSWDSNEGKRLPTSGWIKFVVLKPHSASWFSARLAEDFETDLPCKVAKYYKKESNQRFAGLPEVGNIVAVKEDINNVTFFHRAKVVQFLKLDKHKTPLEVVVKLLDRGDEWKRKIMDLYELPSEFSTQPPTAVDIRLVGVQPMDFDSSWSKVAKDFMENVLSQPLEKGQYWSGKIVLSLNGSLFLESVKRNQFLPKLNMEVIDLSLRDMLLNSRIAVPNTDHFPTLIRLCTEAGIEVPKKEDIKKEDISVVHPQWAFFESDFVRVRFLAAESTSRVFLQQQKFERLLVDLEKECDAEAVVTLKELKSGKGKKHVAVTVGMFCLALFEDGKWNRGRIESENEQEFQVFFVDHGDFLFIQKSDVIPISEKLLLRLPCQAIECRLIGTENTEECPLEVLKEIYKFSDDGAADLYANIIGKDLKASVTGGRKYNLNLVDGRGVSLNKMLVERELVLPEESEREELEDIEMSGTGVNEEGERELEAVKPDVLNYFINLTDDMFEDEDGQEFLNEFASKVLNCSRPTPNKENDSTTTSEENKKKENPAQATDQFLELGDKSQRKKEELELKGRENILTPLVYWSQDHHEVQLKIILSDVKDYSFESTAQNFSFRCSFGQKLYAMDLKLYGIIDAPSTNVCVKAFYVRVILKKIAFPMWPRLPLDSGKHRWISFDVDSLQGNDDDFEDMLKTAKTEIESGLLKEGTRGDFIYPCSDSEESDEGSDESDTPDSECDM